jgi:hypothetical protein
MALTMQLADDRLGRVEPVGPVTFDKATITVRDLIRARVELEIERARDQNRFALGGLVKPGAIETALNGERPSFGFGSLMPRRASEPGVLDRLVADAEEGFTTARYYLLLGDRQAERLDEVIELDRTGEATFLLLTPLQGG